MGNGDFRRSRGKGGIGAHVSDVVALDPRIAPSIAWPVARAAAYATNNASDTG